MKPEEQALEAFIDSLGLRHFRGKELTPYWSRKNKSGANHVPPSSLWGNIVEPLVILDQLRESTGKSIRITSTFRSEAYNKGTGGAKFSQHLLFNAIDFQGHYPPKYLATALKAMRGKRFKNPVTGRSFVFRGGVGLYPTFVHLDTRGHDADW